MICGEFLHAVSSHMYIWYICVLAYTTNSIPLGSLILRYTRKLNIASEKGLFHFQSSFFRGYVQFRGCIPTYGGCFIQKNHKNPSFLPPNPSFTNHSPPKHPKNRKGPASTIRTSMSKKKVQPGCSKWPHTDPNPWTPKPRKMQVWSPRNMGGFQWHKVFR